jgi:carbamoyltransferase
MNILGISAGFHDSAVSVVDHQGHILFASHSERYSKKKHDSHLCEAVIMDALKHGPVEKISYYERPWIKQLRQWYAGQPVDWHQLTVGQILRRHVPDISFAGRPIDTWNHHLSHAAAGFQTSPFDHATVVVVDAIGEFDTVSIWDAVYSDQGRACYKLLYRQRYPHSIGLFYSAITERLGLLPMDEEYITMGMAAWGKPNYVDQLEHSVIKNYDSIEFNSNLHIGLEPTVVSNASNEDLAASAQIVVEKLIRSVLTKANAIGRSKNLVYMGGVALNCLANRFLHQYFEQVWIMPCPGDAGSSLGAAALSLGKKLSWNNAFLGHDIPGQYPVQSLVDHLLEHKIVGVASGRAEFGPRALGNRSLLADPRGPAIKDRVNEIKRRQKFRPFAPVILEEYAHQFFEMPRGWQHSRYMQTVARCRYPNLFPAIIHVDGTSRVQTVPNDGSGIRKLLEAWHAQTQIPLLLNTSLNVRGEPMVNDRADADRFQAQYGVIVFS